MSTDWRWMMKMAARSPPPRGGIRSIRRHLVVRLLAGTLLLSGATATGLYLYLREELIESFDAGLLSQARAVAGLVHAVGEDGRLQFDLLAGQMPEFRSGSRVPEYFAIFREDGEVWTRSPSLADSGLTSPPADELRQRGKGRYSLSLPGGRTGRAVWIRFRPASRKPSSDAARVAAVAPVTTAGSPPLVLVLASDRTELDETLRHLLMALLVVGVATSLGTILLVTIVVRRGHVPLGAVADAATRIDAANLKYRFDATNVPNELRPICERLNDLLGRLDGAFERERRFTADVAHELRTPIAGLVIALGAVVDDAIIDVENIVRRLRLNKLAGDPQSAFTVVLNASLEVRSAIVYASLIIILVFLPIFFMEGVAGSFFRPLALSYALAILASLFVALTVTPAMSLLLIRPKAHAHEPPFTRLLKRGYRAVLPWFVARPAWAVGILLTMFGLTIWAASRLGEEFLPDFQETDFLMHWVEKPSTSLDASRRITVLASKELRAIPGVRNFGSHIGRAEVADEVVGPNFTELWISIDPNVDYKKTLKQIEAVVDGYPGLYRDVLTYLKERIKEVLTGASGSIVVRIYGPDLAVLREKAKEAEKVMGTVSGVANLKVEAQVLVPQIEVKLRPDAAETFGVTTGQLRRQVTTLLRGTKVGEVYQDQKKFAVMVYGVESLRTDLAALRRIPIETPSGAHVPLGDLAEVGIVSAPNEVKREGASRRIDITCNVAGRDLGTVARDIEDKVRTISFPREYHPEFLGEYAARQESRRRLLALAALALVGIKLLLYVDFQSLRLTWLVLLTLPFALVGGVFGIMMAGGVLSLGALVGFVTVLGIAARNGIMLVSHYRHLQQQEGESFGPQLVLRGAEERLAPILMTALATGLALLPLVIDGNKPGQEIEYPLAVVILGGLVTSTLLNLFLLPPLYAVFGKASPTFDAPPAPPGPHPLERISVRS